MRKRWETEIALYDTEVYVPIFFSININNVFPSIRIARTKFLRLYIAMGGLLKHKPQPKLFFQGPRDKKVYVKHWVRNEEGEWEELILGKDTFADPENLILAIMDTCRRCNQLWENYEAEKSKISKEDQQLEAPQGAHILYLRGTK